MLPALLISGAIFPPLISAAEIKVPPTLPGSYIVELADTDNEPV